MSEMPGGSEAATLRNGSGLVTRRNKFCILCPCLKKEADSEIKGIFTS
jgi:hypothetical protein